jgi:hypothetical protein
MEGFHKFLIIGLLIVMALVMFPTVHWGVQNISMTGFLPLFAMVTTFLPYAFVGVVFYIILRIR